MSQTTDFYLSWLGCSAFGANGVRLRDQEPNLFVPTDISGCQVWMDANDNFSVNYNDLKIVSSWTNKGLIANKFDASGLGVVLYGDKQQNGLNTVSFQEYGYLLSTFSMNFQARSVFIVCRPNSFPSNTAVPIYSSDISNCQETFFSRDTSGNWLYFIGKHPSPFPEIAMETLVNYTGYTNMSEFIVGTDLSNNWCGINSPTFSGWLAFS